MRYDWDRDRLRLGQLFYSTQIPACLWFLARDRKNGKFRDRRSQVLFIDARKLGRMVDRTHRELTDDDVARIARVRLDGRTVWLSQRLMAELYQTTVANINQHLTAIYEEGELLPEATIKEYLQVQTEGTLKVSHTVNHFNLDAILAVGYRVRSWRDNMLSASSRNTRPNACGLKPSNPPAISTDLWRRRRSSKSCRPRGANQDARNRMT